MQLTYKKIGGDFSDIAFYGDSINTDTPCISQYVLALICMESQLISIQSEYELYAYLLLCIKLIKCILVIDKRNNIYITATSQVLVYY